MVVDREIGHVWFLESLDAVHRAMQASSDVGEALEAALGVVLEIFGCDRVWLLDAQRERWTPVMERTRPQYPSALELGVSQPLTAEAARVYRVVFDSDWARQLDPDEVSRVAVPGGATAPRSILALGIYPKEARRWILELHQCSRARVWTLDEERLFVEIGHRLADALTILLAYRDVREREQRLAQAQRVARLGYWERDVRTFEIAYSDETYRIFGISPDVHTLEPARLAERLHPDDRHIMLEAYDRAIAGGPRYDVDYRVLLPDGRIRYVHSEADVTWDADGRPLRMFGTMQDITERKLTEERLVRYRDALQELASEQASLRRVATRVARGEPAGEIFSAVAQEAATLLEADLGVIGRYDDDARAVVGVGVWSRTDDVSLLGKRVPLGGHNVTTLVLETGEPARIDDYTCASGASAAEVQARGMSSSIGAPITVAGRLWGAMVLSSSNAGAFLAGAEQRLAQYTDLVATAVANAETQTELAASRARIVTTADETRRRIERDLHDGAQQELVSLMFQLRTARAEVPPTLPELATELERLAERLDRVLEQLREFARGIHPSALTRGGLAPALSALARRCALPVELHVEVSPRPPTALEVAGYYVVSEALANAVKHSGATSLAVEVIGDERKLKVCVRDDGVGGAAFGGGSGLIGLKDRVEALGGRIELRSEAGAGTTVAVEFPLTP